MKYLLAILAFLHFSVFAEYTIVIHGGAGTITRARLSEEKDKEIRSALKEAISIGEEFPSV